MNIISEIPNPPLSPVEVFYNNCKLVPAPLFTFTQEPQFDDAGTRTSIKTRISLNGSIVILPSGSYETLYTKQEELKAAFSVDDKPFAVLAGPGNKTLGDGVVICSGLTPKVNSLTIAEDIHVNRFDYTVELEDLTAAAGVSGITSSLSNQWSFSEDSNNCTVQVTHSVSAEGPDGESDKFEQALRAVKPLLGIDKLPIQLPCFVEPNASGLFGITHPSNTAEGSIFEVGVQRDEVADVANGTYSVTEVFTIVSGAPFYFTARTSSFEEDTNGISTVSIQGTVQGLGRTISASLGSDGGFGFDRACSGFLNNVKPQLPADASGIYTKYKSILNGSGLNVIAPTAFTLSENRCQGTISFSVSYSDDPSANLPSGVVSSDCSVSIQEAGRVIASHAIPFRRLGNIYQDIKTTSEGTISLQCQAQAKNTGDNILDTNRAIAYVEGELERLRQVHANPNDFIDIRISQPINHSFNDKGLTSSASISYAFVTDLASVPTVTSSITLGRL
jgi:hypothetical protein